MLVISRGAEDEIVIHTSDGTIAVKVLGFGWNGRWRGGKVRLGIEAPQGVTILRPDARHQRPHGGPHRA